MRISKSFWNVPSALLATAALLLTAGVASAIFDSEESIDPDSPAYDNSGGSVDGAGSSFNVEVYFSCFDSTNDFTVYCESTHLDNVSLSEHQGLLKQEKNGNNARLRISVWRMGNIIEDDNFYLDCDQVKLRGRSNDSTERIEAQCMLKDCEIPGGLTVAQIESAIQCIDGDVANGDLGNRVQNLTLNSNNEISGWIRSRGSWGE